jgi:hypothetical protein
MEQRHPIAKVDPFTNDGLGQLAPGSGGCRGSGRDASAVPHRFDALAAPQEKHVTSTGRRTPYSQNVLLPSVLALFDYLPEPRLQLRNSACCQSRASLA